MPAGGLGLWGADPRGGGEDRVLLERDDEQLRRRAAKERADEEELVEVARLIRGECAPCRREAGLDLQVRAASRRQRALSGDAAARDEEGARMSGLGGGDDEAALHGTEAREPGEVAADGLERVDAVAQPRCVFVAARIRELDEPPAQPR